jgi:nuclear receptor interaction protein
MLVNIYCYQPENSAKQFELATTIDTGHSRNIFSVKFMPHSNDRTVVTAAGDDQVRVFDIERASFTSGAHQRLSTTSTHAKVFRSHSHAVKRLVTEGSPFYFLSCAEDGEVRQWDIRQPESAYPRVSSMAASRYQASSVAPPPLISYKEYGIDLYTMSCSPSQPHYIALGGSHLHCFLHDRRMLGRDKLRERGGLLSSSSTSDDALQAATRCVRKFAPYGQPEMGRGESKFITACKISDANPNELIASWNGDFIYSFDMLRDGNRTSTKKHAGLSEGTGAGRSKPNFDRKRKQPPRGLSQEGETRAGSRPRTSSTGSESRLENEEMSLLVRMDNGESVEIPIHGRAFAQSQIIRSRTSERAEDDGIASQVRNVRSLISTASRRDRLDPSDSTTRRDESTVIRQRMEQTLVAALKLLEKIDGIMHNWSFPVTESSGTIAFQRKLRDDRGKTWRFIQACGTIARVTSRRRADAGPRRLLEYFDAIRPAPRESALQLERHEQFGYDFIKTVLLWLDSGVGAVIREFTLDRDDPSRSYSKRRPISKDAGLEAIEEELVPYLKALAGDFPVEDVDSINSLNSRIFRTEKDAVDALARAMSVEFADLTGRTVETSEDEVQNREDAVKFWGYRVCRAILKNAAVDVTFALVDTAFGEFTVTADQIREGRLDDHNPGMWTKNEEKDHEMLIVYSLQSFVNTSARGQRFSSRGRFRLRLRGRWQQ